MFEVVRRTPISNPMRDIMDFVTNDAFFQNAASAFEGGKLPLDISENNGEIVVRASLPGFKKEDVDIQVHQGVLTIKAEHKEEREHKDERYYYRERSVGSVSRRVALPGMVDDAKTSAELKDGVLTLRIPQSPQARPKQIQIN